MFGLAGHWSGRRRFLIQGRKELDIRLTDALALLALLELFVMLASLTTWFIYVSRIREGGKQWYF